MTDRELDAKVALILGCRYDPLHNTWHSPDGSTSSHADGGPWRYSSDETASFRAVAWLQRRFRVFELKCGSSGWWALVAVRRRGRDTTFAVGGKTACKAICLLVLAVAGQEGPVECP